MGCILGASGLGVYHVVAHAYRETIDKGLESVADALRKSIEPVSQQPEHIKQLAKQLSLELCVTQADCLTQTAVVKNQIAQAVGTVNYYMRLLNQSGKPIALAGIHLEELPITSPARHWQTITNTKRIHYRQITLPLHTHNQLSGYIQVGRSLKDLEQHLAALRLTLLLGWPISMIFIGACSWWLAGLAMQPVYRSYQQMEQFTADAAHEFRTPLAAMRSTIDAAFRLSGQPNFESMSPPATGGILQVLKRQNTRLSQLVGDLLLLARLDQQQQREYQPCCLNDLISDLVEELAFLAVEAEVKLAKQVQTQEKLYVLGNEEQLYRLISNLIVNAIQATPTGGKITVSLEYSDRSLGAGALRYRSSGHCAGRNRYALIQVQDTGIGIAPEYQSRIFDRFYRVNKDRSRASGGSGLGLAIATAIAKAHKGSIYVQSQLGIGSTFTVRLPLQR
jgi:signal transduction histidine kinase